MSTWAVAGVLMGLLVVTWLFINRSGRLAWNEVRAELEDAGLEVHFQELIPELPPADDNFCTSPMIQALLQVEAEDGEPDYEYPELEERLPAYLLPPELTRRVLPDWSIGKPADLSVLLEELSPGYGGDEGRMNPAPAIREWLKPLKPDLESLDQHAFRSHAVLDEELPLDVVERMGAATQELNQLLDLQELQSVRLIAALADDDLESARGAFRTMLVTNEALSSYPTMIALLIRMKSEQHLMSTLWDTLDDQEWRSSDLEWIHEQLKERPERFMSRVEFAMNAEMCTAVIDACDMLKKPKEPISGFDERDAWLLSLIPDGIWDENKAFGCRLMHEAYIKPVRERNLHGGTMDPEEALAELSPRNFLMRSVMPVYKRIATKAFMTAVSMEMASTACALERYRLDYGEWPEELETLVPRYLDKLPLDMHSSSGASLGYRTTDAGYILYSVGPDAEDDGGHVDFIPGTQKLDFENGDLIWICEPLVEGAGR